MALNLGGGVTAYELMIDNFSKSLTYTPVTKTIDNVEGDETLSDGTPSSITGAFFKREDVYNQEYLGLLQNADAILIVHSDVTINKEDKITYSGEDFRIQEVEQRMLGTNSFYKLARCFKI